MNLLRFLATSFILGALCACATQPTSTSSSTPASPTQSPAVSTSDINVTDLPCANVSNSAGVLVSYPGESLYRRGAALPKMEGLACLEVLADWLKTEPQARWQVTVAGEEGFGFDSVKLAEKRGELLQRFFVRKGVDGQGWQWQPVSGEEMQLQLAEQREITASP